MEVEAAAQQVMYVHPNEEKGLDYAVLQVGDGKLEWKCYNISEILNTEELEGVWILPICRVLTYPRISSVNSFSSFSQGGEEGKSSRQSAKGTAKTSTTRELLS